MKKIIFVYLLSALCFSLAITQVNGAQKGMKIEKTANATETITLGGGCFWCTEAIFAEVKGVEKVVSGYAGGSVADPTYKDVCTGQTGHAEVVQITFNPAVISLKKIIQIFFATHDPTTLNRQGADVGTQYRSIIFYRSKQQKEIIEQVINELKNAKVYKNNLVTEVVPFQAFYQAEDYHQNYFQRNATEAYCRIVINPKLEKLRKVYRDNLKK